MPHMVIAYAKAVENQVQIERLVQNIFDGAEESGLFSTAAIKVRALPVEHFITGGTKKLFVHVDAKMFAGRTDDQKQDLITRLFSKIEELVSDDVAISVEAIDMDTPNYIKR